MRADRATHSRLATFALALAAAALPLAGCSSTANPPAATTTPATATTTTATSGPTAAPTVTTGESTTASIQIGDMLTYGSIGTTATLDCADGKSLNVAGSDNTLTVNGTCET